MIATALCHLGFVVFLGGPGSSISNDWRQIDGGWAGVSRGLLDWISRKPTLRLMASREPRIIETLFDQQGFDWNLRGQLVFVLGDNDTIERATASPDNFATCLQSDPPRRAPQGCIALLRPGTDGDFAEFHAISRQVADSFDGLFSAPSD
jgi:uncharacterized protein YqcC (DUF446 family)